jgi:antitoxin component YwqK of YwqJK toxin-antitoxin module
MTDMPIKQKLYPGTSQIWESYGVNDSGEPHGKFVSYYKNGQIMETTHYIHGKEHGKYESYYEDGTLQRRGAYHYDSLDGKWFLYYDDGSLWFEGRYRQGMLESYKETVD